MATARPPRKSATQASVKPAAKTASKASTRPAAKSAAKAAGARASATAQAVPKADKPRKPKLVRDSFTIPKSEFTVLQELKQRAGKTGAAAKKSEILRAGIKTLAAMNDAAFAAALAAVPMLKTGRPAKD